MGTTSSRPTGIKVFYWPFLIRGASLVRMLEHTGTPYEYISDKAQMGAVCSTWEGSGDTFAPPIVVDGKVTISQSVACCLYLGKRLGLTPSGYDEYKAMQYCTDMVDTFENGVGKNNEDGPSLKKFIEGERFAKLMGNLERGIKGPFYFGAAPSAPDFFLLQQLDWRAALFEQIKAKHGVDVMAPFPKMRAVHETLRATDGYKNYKGDMSLPGGVKEEIIESYNS